MPSIPSPFAAGDCSADKFDPDYLYFLRHLRTDGSSYVLELPPGGASPASVVRYESPIAISDGECVSDPSPGGASTNRRAEEGESSVGAPPPSSIDSIADIDEDYRLFLHHTRVVNNRLKLEIGGVVVDYEPGPGASNSGGSSGVEEQSEKEAAVASSGGEEQAVDSDEPVVIVPEPNEYEWRADPEPRRRVEYPQDTGRKDPLQPRVASKPFSRKEYLNLFDMASIRTPLVKLRQNSAHEDQFRPWTDDPKDQDVVPLMD